jgi:hypothetical protein
MAGKKSNLRSKLSAKFWLLTPTQNQVMRLAMLKNILRNKIKQNINKNKNKNNNNNKKLLQKLNHRLQQVADYQGRNTNIHPFVSPAKGVKKKRGSTHQQRQLTTLCVDAVFHRNLLSADGTDQRILPATLRQTSRT